MLEGSLVANCLLFFYNSSNWRKDYDTRLSTLCAKATPITGEEAGIIDLIFSIRNPLEGHLGFTLVLSILVIQCCMMIMFMLERTVQLGQSIMMLTFMIGEVVRFFCTFGTLLSIFLMIGAMLNSEFTGVSNQQYWQVFINLYSTFNGKSVLDKYQTVFGQIYINSYMYVFEICLMALLVAMFINKQQNVIKNLDAYRRFNIIRLKNSQSFDPAIGGLCLTFFPINIVAIPFMVPIMLFKNPRISEFTLKLQYTALLGLYSLVAVCLIILMVPYLYMKCVVNGIYIVKNYWAL